MVKGDTNPRGPGFIERHVPSEIKGTYPGYRQEIFSGSRGFVPNCPVLNVERFTPQCWIWPTASSTDPRN